MRNEFVQVGANIKKALAAKGISQQELADSLGISKQVMNKIIKGNKAINVNEIAKIASELGTTTDSLLMLNECDKPVENLSFMGSINDDETLKRVNTVRSAIDEIHMLEELLYDK